MYRKHTIKLVYFTILICVGYKHMISYSTIITLIIKEYVVVLNILEILNKAS